MRSLSVWFFLSCKRYIKMPAFIILLLLVPALMFASTLLSSKSDDGIKIALYTEDNDGISREIIESLKNYNGMFVFYESTDKSALEDDVAAKRAECGFVFKNDFKKRLDDNDIKRSIELWSAPSSVVHMMSAEVVYADILSVYERYMLKDYVDNSTVFDGMDKDASKEELLSLFDKRIADGSTFSFRYSDTSSRVYEDNQKSASFPVRGITAVYIFAIAVFSGAMASDDKSRGLYNTMGGISKVCHIMASMAAPVSLAAVSSIAAVCISGYGEGLVKETICMLLYVIGLVIFSYIWMLICRNSSNIAGTIPAWIILCLLVCPVFTDINNYIPQLSFFSGLCPPYYYLIFFT